MAKKSLSYRIRKYLTENPDASVAQTMKDLRIPPNKRTNIYLARSQMRKESVQAIIAQALPPSGVNIDAVHANDPVNNPSHYTKGGIETIDFIEAKALNYRLGNAVKYISRAAHKGNYVEDLKKAAWYIEREIARSGNL